MSGRQCTSTYESIPVKLRNLGQQQVAVWGVFGMNEQVDAIVLLNFILFPLHLLLSVTHSYYIVPLFRSFFPSVNACLFISLEILFFDIKTRFIGNSHKQMHMCVFVVSRLELPQINAFVCFLLFAYNTHK